MTEFIALICVLGIAIGQIIFKLCADSYRILGIFDTKTVALFSGAMLLYGSTTLLWIWVLQRSSLGKIYPLMALAFIIVPLGSHYFFGEKFSSQYMIGVIFISTGIILAVKG